MRQWRPRQLAGTLGVISPFVFVVVTLGLTWHERDFLRESGWSAVARSPVEWPSLLALGPSGWILTVTFVVMAATAAVLAWHYARSQPDRDGYLVTGALGLMGAGLALVAFSADRPSAARESWHAQVHNHGYLLIPFGGVLAMGLLAWHSPDAQLRRGARVLLIPTVVAFAATNIDAIAQLARYVAFAGLLVLVAQIGAGLRRGD